MLICLVEVTICGMEQGLCNTAYQGTPDPQPQTAAEQAIAENEGRAASYTTQRVTVTEGW